MEEGPGVVIFAFIMIGALISYPALLIALRCYVLKCRRLTNQLDEINRLRYDTDVRNAELMAKLAVTEEQHKRQ